MEWLKGEYSKLISFVSEGSQTDKEKKNDKKVHLNSACSLKGNEARDFYEDVVKDTNINVEPFQSTSSIVDIEDQQKIEQLPKKKEHIVKKDLKIEEQVVDISIFDLNRYLRFAQEGMIKEVRMLLEKGVPSDYQDQYGWTALMCAAQNGKFEMVQFLMAHGCDSSVKDKHNKTVIDIANKQGHSKIAEFIQMFDKTKQENDEVEMTDDSDPFYCDVCKSHFSEDSAKTHQSSTVHIFNSKKKAKNDPYILPSSNKGYKMMLRSGWDGCKGLGPEGQGHKYPVKTLLKRDRKCLGAEKDQKPKITHFNPNDKKSIAHQNPDRKLTNRTINKRQQKRNELKKKQWERNLRASMTYDF